MKKNISRIIMAAVLLMSMNTVAHAQLNGLINRGKQALKNEAKKEAKEQGMNLNSNNVVRVSSS